MANIKSQIKRNRQNQKATDRNKAVKSEFKTAIRKFREAADAGDRAQAEALMKDAAQLVDKAASGEDVIVGRHGKPLVRITRLDDVRRPIRFGVLKGRVRVAADFDAPLPDEVLAGF